MVDVVLMERNWGMELRMDESLKEEWKKYCIWNRTVTRVTRFLAYRAESGYSVKLKLYNHSKLLVYTVNEGKDGTLKGRAALFLGKSRNAPLRE